MYSGNSEIFKLESAIKNWKSKLRKHSGFEDGDVAELEDHLRNSIEDLQQTGLSEELAFEEIIDRDYKQLKNI